MNKKLMFGLLGLFAIGLVAATVGYYAMFSTTLVINQSITLDEDCTDSINAFDGDIIVGDKCIITNNAPSLRELTFNNNAPTGIGVTYLKETDYSYSADIAGVGVEVTDDGEWIQWVYTYADTPTHTPKMTVAINYPTGYAITTFDDGSHTGWYYAVDGETEIALDLDWVETDETINTRTVRIKKSALDNEFKWHGYANYNGNPVWINSGEDGTGYSEPIFEVTIREELTNPYNLSASSELVIRPVYEIAPGVIGTYVINTTIA